MRLVNTMNSKTTFAVVDIETTGTDLAADNRTIQFSCCLVSDNKIIDTFVTDINPQCEVPNRIVQLTGIDNDRLKKAPTFDQVAAKLYGLLSGTVFVAHNVNFDFPFLNAEFQRVGYPELQIEAIDTVTLSQILFQRCQVIVCRTSVPTLILSMTIPTRLTAMLWQPPNYYSFYCGKLKNCQVLLWNRSLMSVRHCHRIH